MPYRLSVLAEQGLEEIWAYVAEDASSATADRLIDGIIHRFEPPRMGASGRSSATPSIVHSRNYVIYD